MADQPPKAPLRMTKLRRKELQAVHDGKSPWSAILSFKARFITRTMRELREAGLLKRDWDGEGFAIDLVTSEGRSALEEAP